MENQMFQEYKIQKIVDEAMARVLQAAPSRESDDTGATVIERSSNSNHTTDLSPFAEEDDVPDNISMRMSIDDELDRELAENGYDAEDDEDEEVIPNETELARAHWIQLQKTNKQGIVIQNAFIYILNKYKHIRPVWQFGKNIDDSKDNWKSNLYENFYFRHHCASIQAAITMIMENKDETPTLRKLLNEIGAHHFFYDASEPHLDVFADSMVESMKKVLHGVHSIDTETENSWRVLLRDVKHYMSEGICSQRMTYLRQCMTASEMTIVREKWKIIEDFGLKEAGHIMCDTALATYGDLLRKHNLRSLQVPNVRADPDLFARFADLTVRALDEAIQIHTEEVGFCELPERIKDYVVACLMLDVCPTLVRKSFMEGLVTLICRVTGERCNESLIHLWNKLYRVLEQAVIINIVNY